MNIKRAIEKSDEIKKMLLSADCGYEPVIVPRLAVMDDVRKILLALGEPSEEPSYFEKSTNLSLTTLEEFLSRLEKRLSALEKPSDDWKGTAIGKITGQVARIEERLSRLEEQVRVLNQSVVLNPYRNEPPQFGHSGACQYGCKCGKHYQEPSTEHIHDFSESDYCSCGIKRPSTEHKEECIKPKMICGCGKCILERISERMDKILIDRKVAEMWIKDQCADNWSAMMTELRKALEGK